MFYRVKGVATDIRATEDSTKCQKLHGQYTEGIDEGGKETCWLVRKHLEQGVIERVVAALSDQIGL